MSNDYVENENGFFVKTTLFKDDVNGRKWRIPFTEEVYKSLSKSFGKIPYVDLIGKTFDEHKEIENDKYIEQLQKEGLSDNEIMAKLHEKYSKPEMGAVGYVVDMYDVQKKATYGNVLNTCALSMGMCEKSDPEVAVIDFILKITDKEYAQKIKDGKVKITPSPSLYADYVKENGVAVVNINDFYDMIHVANASYPANGKHAVMKAYCEGTQSSCKKKMLNAALPTIENINNSQTQDTIRMSEQPQNPVTTTETVVTAVPSSGFNKDELTKVLNDYNVPKEVVGKLDALTAIVETLKESNESTKKELEAYKAAEEQRKLAERKALITKHISADTFKGDTEAFTKKIEWINARNFNDEDLAIYLSEAFPIKIESADDKTKDLPDKKSVYGSLQFDPNELLKTETGEANTEVPTKKRSNTWGSLIPLSATGNI